MIKDRPSFPAIKTQMAPGPELSVVMPCYNECEGIESVIREWGAFLSEESVSFELIVINDGSTDGTGRILDRLRRLLPELRVVHQLRTGHGKALRRGYEVARGQFILQVDSNGRYEPSDFVRMWEKRQNFDLILAHRTHRLDSMLRRAICTLLCKIACYFFGVRLSDPNVPFRLFSKERAETIFEKLPNNVISTNLLTSLMIQKHAPDRVLELPVPFRLRPRGKVTLSLLGYAKLCLIHLAELTRLRFAMTS
ncbi:MAG: glycosyltransferase family 2 protein [Deltaproteobacteria bacterium]|nr:glycosyltransferase family 2 protein [Deltaproteobacteria bacterium]